MEHLDDLLARDLDYITDVLHEEFATMAGSNLLITGGGGFLGYYLVHSVLYWNQKHGSLRPIQVTVFDNYRRGVPKWLTDMQGDKNLTLIRHDVSTPLPDTIGDFQYIIHAAGIASPTYYRKFPIETMDTNITGLRALLNYAQYRVGTPRQVYGFLFYSSSEIYGQDPNARGLSRQRLMHGPAGML
jgi:UDP-glucuronate decarboxylase